MKHRLVVLGASGLVGRTMLTLVEERGFPVAAVRLLASDNPESRTLPFRSGTLPVEPVHESAFQDANVALFASSNEVSRRWAPVARAAGTLVIDNSSAFRYEPDVPLVVPEINGDLVDSQATLIANPNCSTVAIVMALAALRPGRALQRVSVSTYQSASGAGSGALARLESGLRAGLEDPAVLHAAGPASLAFNVVPQIDRFEANGYSREEMKVVWETRKILDMPDLPVSATAVRVPVRVGHCASVTACFDPPVSPDEARRAWADFPGITVVDDPGAGRYPTPLEAEGRDDVLVGRARRDLAETNALTFFVASDNLRKGAALNAVQIAECWSAAAARRPSGAR
jgi:aspartate-semialdehyde dehydrogenase